METYSEWLARNPQVADQAFARAGGLPVAVAAPAPQPQVIAAPPPAPEVVPVQEAEPVVVQAPVTPMVEPAVRPDMSRPAQAVTQIQDARIADANAIGESHIREGEVKAQAAELSASEYGKFVDKAKDRTDRAEANHDANRGQMDKYKRYLDEDLEELRKPILQQNGYQKSVGIITGIVGAMAQQNGGAGNAGLAAGMGMLNAHANRNITQQFQERDQASDNFKRNQAAIATLSKDSSDEIDIANKLMANQWLVSEAELKRIGTEAKAPEYRENAMRLATGARDEANKYLEAIAASKIKRGGTAKTDWSKFPVAALEAAESSGELPAAGVEYLNKVRKGAKDAAPDEPKDGGKTKLAYGQEVAGKRYVVNADLAGQHTATELAKFNDEEQTNADLNAQVNELLKLRRNHSFAVGAPGTAEYKAARTLGKQIQLAVKKSEALGTLDNGSVDFLNEMTGDSTAWLINSPEEPLKVIRDAANDSHERKAQGFGISARGAAPPAPPGQPTQRWPGAVGMNNLADAKADFRPDGK